MNFEPNLRDVQGMWHGTIRSYVIGFFGALILTSLSFYLVAWEILQGFELKTAIATLAVVQAALQVVFFLHLGKEGSPWWESVIFGVMFIVLLIIAAGSLWIMYDLDVRTMRMGM